MMSSYQTQAMGLHIVFSIVKNIPNLSHGVTEEVDLQMFIVHRLLELEDGFGLF